MTPWNTALLSILPTLVVGGIFWFTMRAIFRADRTERTVYNRIEAEERERMGLPPVAPVASATSAALAAPTAEKVAPPAS